MMGQNTPRTNNNSPNLNRSPNIAFRNTAATPRYDDSDSENMPSSSSHIISNLGNFLACPSNESPFVTPNASPTVSPATSARRLKRATTSNARTARRICVVALCTLGVLLLFNVVVAPALISTLAVWWSKAGVTNSQMTQAAPTSPQIIQAISTNSIQQDSILESSAVKDAVAEANAAVAVAGPNTELVSGAAPAAAAAMVVPPTPPATCAKDADQDQVKQAVEMEHRKQANAILKKIGHPSTHQEQCQLRFPQMNNTYFQEMISKRNDKFFIAANLFNSEKITPDWLLQLTRLISLLGASNTFVSVYESGSDDTTPEWLTLYDAVLTAVGVEHELVSHGNVTKKQFPNASGSFQRIEFLAAVRNAALEPLYRTERGVFTKIIFINDIFYCAEDILMLLSHDNVDLVSGLDFDDPGFYDTWVARDLTGRPLSKPYPWVVGDDASRTLTQQMDLVPMMCTWNGAVVLNADVFYGGIRFRAGNGKEGECTASECSHLCEDMWEMNFTRIAVDPMISVAYDHHTYNRIPTQNWFKNTFAHRLRRTQSKYEEKERTAVAIRLDAAKERVNYLHAQPFLQAPVPYPFEWFCCGLRPSALPHWWCCAIDEKNMYLPKNCKWERLWIETKTPSYLELPTSFPTKTEIINSTVSLDITSKKEEVKPVEKQTPKPSESKIDEKQPMVSIEKKEASTLDKKVEEKKQ